MLRTLRIKGRITRSLKQNLCENTSVMGRSGGVTDCNSSLGSPVDFPLNMVLVFDTGSWQSGQTEKTSWHCPHQGGGNSDTSSYCWTNLFIASTGWESLWPGVHLIILLRHLARVPHPETLSMLEESRAVCVIYSLFICLFVGYFTWIIIGAGCMCEISLFSPSQSFIYRNDLTAAAIIYLRHHLAPIVYWNTNSDKCSSLK